MANAPRKREPRASEVEKAIAYEQRIANEAEAVRQEYAASLNGDGKSEPLMDRALFMRLWPLLRRPIPKGFLLEVSAGEGKPYPSTGVRSVQVQMDRMDDVLTPLWWSYITAYDEDGKVCHVTVMVHGSDGECLVTRDAYGGVNRGSTQGNLRKGSFTNAAKQALARIGPAHEVYIGVTDHDPDVDEEAAKQQSRAPAVSRSAPAEDSDESVRAELALLLEEKVPVQQKRRELNEALMALGLSPRKRLATFKEATTNQQLIADINRANAVREANEVAARAAEEARKASGVDLFSQAGS